MQDITLEELRAKRKEIDEQIRALVKGQPITCGCARLDKTHYPTMREDEWCVSVKKMTTDTGSRETWQSIIRGTQKDVVIGCLPGMIRDLQGLYDMLTGEKQ